MAAAVVVCLWILYNEMKKSNTHTIAYSHAKQALTLYKFLKHISQEFKLLLCLKVLVGFYVAAFEMPLKWLHSMQVGKLTLLSK